VETALAIVAGLLVGYVGAWIFAKIRDRFRRPASPLSDENFWLIHEWAGRNSWYHENSAMRQFAEREHVRLTQAEPALTLSENLDKVARAVKEKYPAAFRTLH
jgi:hypothetical protein